MLWPYPKTVSSSSLSRYAHATARFVGIEFDRIDPHAMQTTASLRASATFAFIMPARLASFIAQLLSAPPLIEGRPPSNSRALCALGTGPLPHLGRDSRRGT